MTHSSASGASVCRFWHMFRLADLHIIHQKAGQPNPIHSCGLPASPSASTTHAIALHSSPNSCLILVPTHCCRSKQHSYVYDAGRHHACFSPDPTRLTWAPRGRGGGRCQRGPAPPQARACPALLCSGSSCRRAAGPGRAPHPCRRGEARATCRSGATSAVRRVGATRRNVVWCDGSFFFYGSGEGGNAGT